MFTYANTYIKQKHMQNKNTKQMLNKILIYDTL